MTIQAYDTAYPGNTASSPSTINVRRNLHAPIFNPADYVTRIRDEHIAAGTPINITVTATDQDDDVSKLSVLHIACVYILTRCSSFDTLNSCC